MKGGLPRAAWVGIGLLVIAGAVLSVGSQDTRPFPAMDSYAPSGTAAFAELLRREGFDVEVDRSERPNLAPGDLAIGFRIVDTSPLGLANQSRVLDSLADAVTKGTNLLVLPIGANFPDASRASMTASPATVRFASRDWSVDSLPDTGQDPFVTQLESDDAVSVDLAKTSEKATLTGVQRGKGTAFIFGNGIVATNRFIARNDDAALLLSLVSALSRAKSRIVFTEAAFDNIDEPSLVESIGPWAAAAWQQLLFLGIVIILTLGKRFGLPMQTRSRQRGSRELADAIAELMVRSGDGGTALRLISKRADAEIRSSLHLPTGLSADERDRSIPLQLAQAIRRVEALQTVGIDDRRAVDAVNVLDSAKREAT